MNKNLELSCEVYPPKGENFEEKIEKLKDELIILKNSGIDFVSVTYGAGGSNRDNSIKLVEKLHNSGFKVMPHFTCVCSSTEYIKKYVDEIKNLGIKNILALRGDEPQDIDVCYLDFKHAYELVDYLNKNTNFNIAVAGYPEKHPNAKTIEDDILNLKKKIEMGAKCVYTQLFFNNDYFYKYVDLCTKQGINVPIIPGIMPIVNYKQLEKMTTMCHATIPNELKEKLEKYQEDELAIKEIGVEYATSQCQDLIKNGTYGLHFYILNKADSLKRILENIK